MNGTGRLLYRGRYGILAAWFLTTCIGAVAFLASFRIDNSVGVWFPDDDPALRAYERALESFGPFEWTLVLLETESVHDEAFLNDLRELTERLEQLNHVHQVLPEGNLFERAADARKMLLLLETDNLIRRQDRYRWSMLRDIRKAVEETPTVQRHRVAGTAVLNTELNRSARRDMFVFVGLVCFTVPGLCLWLLRSWRDTLVVVAVALSTAAVTLGVIALCGYSFNILTIMLPTVLIAVSVADTIHVVHAFHQQCSVDDVPQTIQSVVAELWRPCLGTSVTTMVGLLSLSATTVLPILQIAVFCSLGVALACLFSLVLGPVLLAVLWGGSPPRRPPGGSGRSPWLKWVDAAHGRPILVVTLFVLIGTGLAGLSRLEADTDYVDFFRPSSAVPTTYAALDEAGYPQSSLSLIFENDPKGGDHEAQRSFVTAVSRLSPGITVIGPTSEAARRVRCISGDGRLCRIFVLTPYLSSKEVRSLRARIVEIREQLLPEVDMTVTGTAVLWTGMDSRLVLTQKRSAVIVLLSMFVVLVVILRSFVLGLLGWLVSVFPVALILGLMGLAGVKVNMGTVLIAGIAIGLAVDDTIHLLFYYLRELKTGLAAKVALGRAIENVGTRIMLTTLIVMGGFACMSVSSFMPTAEFGLFTCLTIFLAALTDLVLLPVLLKALDKAGWRCSSSKSPCG